MGRTEPGAWGVVTSSVDWCESNYAASAYVCELFNTISSFALVLSGLLGFALHRRTLECRFLLAFLLVALVGVGSIAFHGTLRFELQMLDELPMLFTVVVFLYCLLEDEPTPKYGKWLPWALASYAALMAFLCAFTRGRVQFFTFQVSFGTLEFYSIYRAYRLYSRSTSGVARRLFQVGISLYAAALVAWFTDIRFCKWVSVTLPRVGLFNPQLHAVWHVLVSAGLYSLLLFIAFSRERVLGKEPQLTFLHGIVPYVRSRSSE